MLCWVSKQWNGHNEIFSFPKATMCLISRLGTAYERIWSSAEDGCWPDESWGNFRWSTRSTKTNTSGGKVKNIHVYIIISVYLYLYTFVLHITYQWKSGYIFWVYTSQIEVLEAVWHVKRLLRCPGNANCTRHYSTPDLSLNLYKMSHIKQPLASTRAWDMISGQRNVIEHGSLHIKSSNETMLRTVGRIYFMHNI